MYGSILNYSTVHKLVKFKPQPAATLNSCNNNINNNNNNTII